MSEVILANPWEVSSLKAFLYYNCPECEEKCSTSEQFIGHAIVSHVKARIALPAILGEALDDEEDPLQEPKSHFNDDKESQSVFIAEVELEVKTELGKEMELDEKVEQLTPEIKLKVEDLKMDLDDIVEPNPDKEFDTSNLELNQQNQVFSNAKIEDKVEPKIDPDENHIKMEKPKVEVRSQGKRLTARKSTGGRKRAATQPMKMDTQESQPKTKLTKTTWKVYSKELGSYVTYAAFDEPYLKTEVDDGPDENDETCNPKSMETKSESSEKVKEPIPRSKRFQCELCPKTYPTKLKLETHMNSIYAGGHGTKYECDKCDYVCKTNEKLENHTQKKHGPKIPSICEHCNKEFATKTSYIDHVESVHQGAVFICDICSKTFTTRTGLHKHNKVIHEGKRKTYNCETCGKDYANKEYLILHQSKCIKKEATDPLNTEPESHKKDQFQCEQCPKICSSKTHLKHHVRTVHEGFSLQCLQCPKTFGTKSALFKHVRTIHEGIRETFSCEQCDKGFASKFGLDLHTVKHHPKENDAQAINPDLLIEN